MPRYTIVYPADGSEPFLKTADYSPPSGPMIAPDLPDFVSPVDGKHYSGRAGMREHNLRNGVVPNAELKGLPTLMTNSDLRSPEERRRSAEQRKQMVIQQVNRHYR